MGIAKNKVVTIHYTLKNKEGNILDTSDGGDPLAYIQGAGNIVAGLEKALEGKTVGEKVKTVVSPKEGYGVRTDSLVQEVPLSEFGKTDEVKVGTQFQVRSEKEIRLATVKAIDGDKATLDLNHPLADETLHFSVEVLEVRDATSDELAHGHVHGPGGHHH